MVCGICGICYYEELTPDVSKRMLCGHFVCLDCYFKLNNNKCPYCRGEIKHALFAESALFKRYFLREITNLIKNIKDTTLANNLDHLDPIDQLVFIINFEDETIEEDFVYEIDGLYKLLRNKVYKNILLDGGSTQSSIDLFHF
jgi:hypothetical protein